MISLPESEYLPGQKPDCLIKDELFTDPGILLSLLNYVQIIFYIGKVKEKITFFYKIFIKVYFVKTCENNFLGLNY